MIYFMERILFLLALGFLFLSSFCGAEYRIKCSNNAENRTSMIPSEDGVKGRYTVEWCTNINERDKDWNIEVYYNRKNPKACSHLNKHSAKTEYFHNNDVNCSSVCLYTELDLIFSACYRLENVLKSHGSLRNISYHKIENNYTMMTFSGSEITGKEVNHGDYISATFFSYPVPASKYDMELYYLSDASCKEEKCPGKDVGQNCSNRASVYEVACRLQGLPPGSYELALTNRAPWVQGDFMRSKVTKRLLFNVTASSSAALEAEGGGWRRRALVGAFSSLGALLVAAALLLTAARMRHAKARRKGVLRAWLRWGESKSASEPIGAGATPGPILLLYAREGPALEPCIAALTRLLETVAPGQVYDLYGAETTAMAAASGESWVRGLMAKPDSRVLLLQTVAMAALHQPNGADTEQPLLGTRGVYRLPLAGDRLLPLALRLAQQSPHPPYRKYYLATLQGLETETLPHVVPFCRYVLPRNGLALLRDLGGVGVGGAHQRLLADELARAVASFVDHVHANPRYLEEQLLFF